MATRTPAQVLLDVEKQNIARYGQATPQVATGPIQANSNLPAGFGADATNRIFRYNPDGSIKPATTPSTNQSSTSTPAPNVSAPSTTPTPSPSPSSSSQGGTSQNLSSEVARLRSLGYTDAASIAGTINRNNNYGTSYSAEQIQSMMGAGTGSAPNGILSPEEYAKKFGAAPVDEEAIRERIRRENQAQIDAIDAVYNSMVVSRERVNEGNMGSARALAARGGTLTSDFGRADLANQKAENDNAIRAINAERAMKIAQVFKEVNQMAVDEAKAKRLEAQGKADEYKAYLLDAQNKARESAKTLGTSGLSFDDLKKNNPAELEQILKNTGYDEFTLAQIMNSSREEKEKINYEYKVAGNKLIGYGVDPITKKISTVETTLPQEFAGNDVKVIDNEIWSISQDGKTATKLGGPGSAPKLPVSAQEYEYAKQNGYTGTFEQYQNEDANRKAQASNQFASEFPSGFTTATQQGLNELQSGTPWATVWNRIKTLYPNIPDSAIDSALGTQWREPGAYEAYAKNQQQFRGSANSGDDAIIQALTQRYGG